MAEQPPARMTDRLHKVLMFAAGIFCASWCTHLFLDDERLVSFVSDDAFYYLQVADNIADGAGSSFDTMNETNGYHPLWMAVLVPLRWVFGGLSKMAFLRLVLFVQAAITVVTIRLLWKCLRSFSTTGPAALGLAFFSIASFSPITGLETALVSCTITWCVWLIITERSAHLVGLSLGLIALSRLDFAIVAAVLGLTWVALNLKSPAGKPSASGFVKAAGRVFVVPACLAVAYLIFNYVMFGHPLPVTFAIKTVATSTATFDSLVSAYGSRAIYAPVLLGPIGVKLWRRSYGDTQTDLAKRAETLVAGLGLAALTHIGYLALSVNFGAARWHLIPHGVAYALCIAVVAQAASEWFTPRRWTTVFTIATVAVLGLGVATNARVVQRVLDPPIGNASVPSYRVAVWVEANTEPDAVIGFPDAGIVGYLSERRVVNLDGLTNSFDTFDAIRTTGLCSELVTDWEIDYFIALQGVVRQQDYGSVTYSFPGWAPTTSVTLTEESERLRVPRTPQTSIVVWDYADATCTHNPIDD